MQALHRCLHTHEEKPVPTCFQNVAVGQPGGVISQLQGLSVPVSATNTLICWLLCKQVRTRLVEPWPDCACQVLRDLPSSPDVPPVYPTSVALTPGSWLKTASCTASQPSMSIMHCSASRQQLTGCQKQPSERVAVWSCALADAMSRLAIAALVPILVTDVCTDNAVGSLD